MQYSWKKKRENKLSPSYENQPYEVAARYGDQVVLRTPEGAEYKRNLQHIKPLVTEAAADAGCSAESENDPPEPAQGPQLTDQPTPGYTPTGVTVTCTPRRSGRLSQPPKALADYVLY